MTAPPKPTPPPLREQADFTVSTIIGLWFIVVLLIVVGVTVGALIWPRPGV